ncbi:MAG: hypothetical protein HY274_08145 [Gammaproteobacteria bacterium]|nr:hypothetical protein [Gammaproteobacteria bacterium]
MLIALAQAGCTSPPRIPMTAIIAGQSIETTVDSELARYYGEHYWRGVHTRPEFDAILDRVHNTQTDRLATSDELAQITRETSADVATLYLAGQLLGRNKTLQNRYNAIFQTLTRTRPETTGLLPRDDRFVVLFVPGWFYKSDTTTGADFARPREILGGYGIREHLIEIEENGTIEENAQTVLAAIQRWSSEYNLIILVSASKAGPEVAWALTELARSGASHRVVAWVNIGGLLRGTRLADVALTWPARWYVKFFMLRGAPLDAIESLQPQRRRLGRFVFPDGLIVVNYVAMPLSGDVSKQASTGYRLLREAGPNDGLTLIADEMIPGTDTVIELGVDHYYRHPQIDMKTAALAQTVMELVREKEQRAPDTTLRPTSCRETAFGG